MERRKFIRQSAAAGAAVTLSPYASKFYMQRGANDKVVLAIIGLRSRGTYLARTFLDIPGCEIKYIVDVDKRYFDSLNKEIAEKQNKKPENIIDYRKALDDKDVDAVAIATQDHWHAPMAIDGVKAGKHVYVEKPCSHNPHEGELLIEAMKKYGKLMQIGTQRRSMNLTRQLVREISEGIIGNVYFANAWYSSGREPIGFGRETDVPDYLDYELWQGPAPRVPYRDNIHPYNWHWFWHWGTGEALNNGTHEIDMARWGLGVDYPVRVSSLGGRYHYIGQDDWECPDTQTIILEFADKKMITWEGRSCNRNNLKGKTRGVVYHGTKGSLAYLTDSYRVLDPEGKLIKEVTHQSARAVDPTDTTDPGLGADHSVNFIESVRGTQKLNAPIDEGHKSVLLCQLGNIALRTGQTLNINKNNGRIIDSREAEKLWSREYEPGWEPKV